MADLYTLAKEDTTRLVGTGISAHQPGLLVTRDGRLMRHHRIPLVYGTMLHDNTASDSAISYRYTFNGRDETETRDESQAGPDFWHEDIARCELQQYVAGSPGTPLKEMCDTAREKLSALGFSFCDPARLVQEFQPRVLGGGTGPATVRWETYSHFRGQILGDAQKSTGGATRISCISRMEGAAWIPEWVGFPGVAGGCRVPLELTIAARGSRTSYTGSNIATTFNPVLSVFHFADEWTNKLPVGPCKLYAQYQLPALQVSAASIGVNVTLTTSVDITLPPDRIIGCVVTPCPPSESLWDYLFANLDYRFKTFSTTSSAIQALTNSSINFALGAEFIVRAANIGG